MNIRWSAFLNYNFFAVLFFTLLALFLNLMYLSLPSLWVDEAWLVNVAKEPVSVMINKLLTTDAHLPVYYLIIKFAREFLGNSETALRFPALLFGLSLVPAVYFLGKELFSKKIGLWASFLAATSYFVIWFSH
ncbi:MAG: glycosyltransferase family 39 protein [bacterium]|nr:glycosyltransferase family 39 protein [bacterium]